MKSKFLVNLKNNGKDKWVAKCASANIQVESNSKDEALSKIEKEFKQFLTYEAARGTSNGLISQGLEN